MHSDSEVDAVYKDAKATPTRGIAIMAYEGGRPTRLFDVDATWVRWTPDSRSLLYSVDEGGVSNLWTQPIAGGPPKQMTHFNSYLIATFELSADGKRFVMVRETASSQVMLIRDVK